MPLSDVVGSLSSAFCDRPLRRPDGGRARERRPGDDLPGARVKRRIRPLALAVIRRGDEILVEEGRDETKDETFFRLPGGRIEFGEPGAEALERELREELRTMVEVGRFLGAVENLFTYEGEPGHEIALVYECRFGDPELYEPDEREISESLGERSLVHRLSWKRVESFAAVSEILYPDGSVEQVERSAPSR